MACIAVCVQWSKICAYKWKEISPKKKNRRFFEHRSVKLVISIATKLALWSDIIKCIHVCFGSGLYEFNAVHNFLYVCTQVHSFKCEYIQHTTVSQYVLESRSRFQTFGLTLPRSMCFHAIIHIYCTFPSTPHPIKLAIYLRKPSLLSSPLLQAIYTVSALIVTVNAQIQYVRYCIMAWYLSV